LHQREYKYKLRSCAAGPIYPQYPSGANMLAAGSVPAMSWLTVRRNGSRCLLMGRSPVLLKPWAQRGSRSS